MNEETGDIQAVSAAPEAVQQEQAAVEQTAPATPDYQKELETAKAELEKERALRLQHERGNSRLADSLKTINKLSAKMEKLEKMIELDRDVQSGRIDEATRNQRLNQIDQERQQSEFKETIEQNQQRYLQTIGNAFKRGNIQPNSEEGLKVKLLVDQGDFAGAIDLANELALDNTKKSVPSEKEIEQRILERLKKSPAMQVSQASPGASVSSADEIIKRYAEGDRSITTEQYEKAKQSL